MATYKIVNHPFFGYIHAEVMNKTVDLNWQDIDVNLRMANFKKPNMVLLDKLADQMKRLDVLHKQAKDRLYDYIISADSGFVENYFSNLENTEISPKVETFWKKMDKLGIDESDLYTEPAVRALIDILSLDFIELLVHDEDSIVRGVSQVRDDNIAMSFSYKIAKTMSWYLLFVHFDAEGEFVKVTYGIGG